LNFKSIAYLSILFLLATGIALIPVSSNAQKTLKQANAYYESGQYCQSIPLYSKYLNAYIDREALVKRGRAYYHCNQLEEAVNDFNDAVLLNYDDNIIDYYLAKAFHHRHDFETAIEHYKKFLSQNLKDENVRSRIIREIKYCANGIQLEYIQTGAKIENMGSGVNTAGNEINMLQSPGDENRFYYSQSSAVSPGKYDIMVYDLKESDWLKSKKLNEALKDQNQVIAAISSNGQQLFFSRYDDRTRKNTLYTDDYISEIPPLTNIHVFEGPISYELGDRDLFYINDSTFLFSSNRLGGFGGYDIFLTGHANGNWFKPVNLGSQINSANDEITPSMDPSNSTLFFSSDNERSMGGFDIFITQYNTKEGSWGQAVNMGFPFNSAGNDFNFKLLRQSNYALITSDRKTSGYGKFDIYQLILQEKFESRDSNGLKLFLNDRILEIAYPRHGIQKLEVNPTVIRPDSIANVSSGKEQELSEFESELIQLTDKMTGGNEQVTYKTLENESILKVKSLFYDDSNPVLENKHQQEYINSIIETMHANPSFNLKMVGHVSAGDSPWQDLERSIAILLPIVKYMADEGVAPDHIFVSGAGSNLPVARYDINDRLFTAADRLNNRISFHFFNTGNSKIDYELPFVVQHLREDDWFLYQTVESDLAYKLEFQISSQEEFSEISESLPYGIADMDIFTTEKRYYFGIYTKYREAIKAVSSVFVSTGKKGVVRAFVDRVPIDDDNILDYAGKYIDLINFMESEK
jgi:tetratricopeptide (TPR) repeat protein